jgi:hypothetical protein
VSGEWSRLAETMAFTAGQLRRFADELAEPQGDAHEEHVAEQTVFLAADLAMAASAALEARYPLGGTR